jgi:universal stress protein A
MRGFSSPHPRKRERAVRKASGVTAALWDELVMAGKPLTKTYMKTASLKTTSRRAARTTLVEPVRANGKVRVESILVPTDFSEASAKAVSYATTLAEQFNAKLTFLYVIEPLALPDFEGTFPLMLQNDNMTAVYKEKLLALSRRAVPDESRLVNVLVRNGRAYHEITEAARTLKVDLIVIATNGYSGLNHVILGSVTERVVRHAPVRCWSSASTNTNSSTAEL